MAKKMIIVDPKLLAPPVPNMLNEKITDLDGEITEILNSKHLPDAEKVIKYREVIQKYAFLADKYRNKQNIQTFIKPPSPPQETELTPQEMKALELVPDTKRKRAKLLLLHLKGVPGVRWNSLGELEIDNKPIKASNITDLVNDVMRQRKSQPDPRGWREFAEILKQSNAPIELIGNPKRRLTGGDNGDEGGDEEVAASTDISPETEGKRRSKKRKRKQQAPLVAWESFD